MAEHTIDIPLMEVYEKWGSGVEPLVHDNWSMDTSDKVSNFPYARIRLLGNPARNHNLNGDECATTLSFQVESYDTGQMALDSIYKIDSASHDSMVSMGFMRNYGPELIENIDTKVKRLVSRYTRIYTGEEL